MGSIEFLIPWAVLGIWFAIFSWLGTGTMLEKWGKKKGFDKLVKKDSGKIMFLAGMNSFVEAFFIYLLYIMVLQVNLFDNYSYFLFFALLGVVVQIPVRVSLALTMNLPERFMLGEVVGGILKYIIGGLLLMQFSPLG